MGAFATSNPTGSSDVTGSGTANQVSVWASASSLTVGTIPFTSSATGYTIGSLVAEPGGILTLTSTTQGFIPPRMTTAQASAIASPIAGVTIYNTDLGALVTYTGAAYQAAILNGGNTFGADISIGTKDHQAIKFLINNTEIWRMNGTNGYLSNTVADATAQLELSSATGAGLAPIRLNSGALIATPLAGAIEFLTDSFYATITTGAARRKIAFIDGGQTFSSATWNGTAIGAVYGGTGQTTVTTGDLLYGSAANTWSKLASVAAGSYLRSGGVTTAPVWSTLILPDTATVNQIVYASSANTYGGSSTFLWNGTSFLVGTASQIAAGNVADFFRNQNGATSIWTTNNTSGTAAFAMNAVSADNGTTNTSIRSLSAGYTTSGMLVASTGIVLTTCTAGMNIGTFSNTQFSIWTNNTQRISVTATGRTFFGGSTAATAIVHLAAGTASASTAPLKFTSGTNLTTAEAGAMEYNGTNLFFTRSGTTRENVLCVSAVNSVSPTAQNRTLTVNVDGTTYYVTAKTTND